MWRIGAARGRKMGLISGAYMVVTGERRGIIAGVHKLEGKAPFSQIKLGKPFSLD
jgi:hypothetical protein